MRLVAGFVIGAGELIITINVLDGRNPNIFDILACLAGLDQRPEAGVVITKIESIMKKED
ncbi:MAG: hypothetical protein J7L25_04615 [Deltaproteobacteria bacterium]|nr:hypothetical protein [Candidatus Tharpella aukensis]